MKNKMLPGHDGSRTNGQNILVDIIISALSTPKSHYAMLSLTSRIDAFAQGCIKTAL